MRTMLEVINSIPKLLKAQVAQAPALKAEFSDLKMTHVVMIASGSSYNAALGAKLFAEEKLNLNIELFYPNYFLHHVFPHRIQKDALYLFISQTGRTKTVLHIIEQLNQKAVPTAALTESLASPIAQAARYSFPIGSQNEPYLFRTSGYTLSLVTLYMLLLQLSVNNQQLTQPYQDYYLEELRIVGRRLPKVIRKSQRWYHQHRQTMQNSQAFIFAGGGELWATAQEAEIKFMEMVPIITNSYEIEELIHGPQNCFHAGMTFFLLSESWADVNKANKIQAFIESEITPNVFLLSRPIKTNCLEPHFLGQNFTNLEYITFLQVLSYLTAQDHKRDLTKTMFPRLTKYLNKTV
ncbi:SIS domain-containing protein [Lactobacillus sp. DCY120]|uniref:SIS domain-containing protein n=1 Tax=Bombilactobacillus apium TaxID=2675299 RepID=A0A850R6C5_9LACO|nr:SIS domain-containing protein [Bombilactobacillus apium]NVY96387.1 SIS domain-containing protein [Bombilactobacillus apium]